MRALILDVFGRYAIGLGIVLCSVACTPYLYDHYTPAKWIVVYCVGALAWIFLFTKTTAFHFFSPYRIPILLLLLVYALGILVNPTLSYRGQLLDWLAFTGVAFATFECQRSAPRKFLHVLVGSILVSTLLVLAYGLVQVLGTEPFPRLHRNSFPSSFFGFQNMTAEFMGYSILGQVFALQQTQKPRAARAALITGLGISFLYLFFLHSRAVYIALVPALAVLAYPQIPKNWRRRATVVLGCAWVVVAIAIAVPMLKISSSTSDFQRTKTENANLRIIRWVNTATMIAANPWGTGPGSYEFSYLPHHSAWKLDHEVTESTLARSPHNEYLRVIAENGLLVAISLFFLGLAVLRRLGRASRRQPHPNLSWVFAVLVFTSFEAIFAFPMENAFPFLHVAVIVGLGCASTSRAQDTSSAKLRNRLLLGATTAIYASLAFSFSYSKFAEANLMNDPQALNFACRAFPSNWRPCVRSAEIAIAGRRLNDAEDTLKSILRRTPENYLALRFLSYTHFEKGNHKAGCTTLAMYDSLFRDQPHSLRDGFKNLCVAKKSPAGSGPR